VRPWVRVALAAGRRVATLGKSLTPTCLEGSPVSSLNCDGWRWLNLESLNHCRRRQRETDVLTAGPCHGSPPPLRAVAVCGLGWSPTGARWAYRGEPACRVGQPAKVAQHSETIWYKARRHYEMWYKILNSPSPLPSYTTRTRTDCTTCTHTDSGEGLE